MGSTYRLGVVTLATLAMWGVATSLLYVQQSLWLITSYSSADRSRFMFPISLLLLLVASVLVFRWREALARRWFGSETEPAEASLSIEELQHITFAAVGAYVVVMSVPELVPIESVLLDYAQTGPDWPSLIATLLRIAFGLLLLVRGKRLSRLWATRTAG